jgi:Protein of unknown function (DUF2877)
MAVLPAHRVAMPVLERLAAGPGLLTHGGDAGAAVPAGEAVRGRVVGVGATAAWVDLDGFVVAVTTREVPLLPNAVALAAGAGTLPAAGVRAGATARLAPGRVDLGTLQITWDPAAPPSWEPAVPVPVDAGPEAVARRGAALLHALGIRLPPEATDDSSGPVDSHGNPPRESATFPLRGPQQPGVADPAALPGGRQPEFPDPAGPDPADLVRDPDQVDLVPNLVPDVADDLVPDLVRDLARVGLATAVDPGGAAGLAVLLGAVRERDPGRAVGAVRGLLGRGPGLTPEGDDLVAAVAGTLAVVGPVAGLRGPTLGAFMDALAPVPGRTNALSATLLELAAQRRLVEPAGRLLDLGPTGETAWPAALRRLERLGHGSGRAYAIGIAATASLLAAD